MNIRNNGSVLLSSYFHQKKFYSSSLTEEMTDESMTINKSLKTSSTFLILFLYFLTNFIL